MPAKPAGHRPAARLKAVTSQPEAPKVSRLVKARKSPTAKKAPVGAAPRGVFINIPGLAPIPVHLPERPQVQKLALQWTYSLRNRARWAGRPDHVDKHRRETQECVRQLGITAGTLASIASASLIEIEIPFVDEEHNWEERIMPWEYLLATATRDQREQKTLTIVRYLRVDAPRLPLRAPRQWHYVESAPGGLRDEFDFTKERGLLEESLRLASTQRKATLLPTVQDPDVAGLAQALRKVKDGDVVHFAGFDPHDGLRRLNDPNADKALDGYLVRSSPKEVLAEDASPGEETAVCAAKDLATYLCADGHPRLATFNIYHSAPRTAALAVAFGAESAIGFIDWFDDYLAEVFFTTFYRVWSYAQWDTVAAFQYAWQFVRAQKAGDAGKGSGLVLWSRRSILETRPDLEQLEKRLEQKKAVQLTPETACDELEVKVEPLTGLNYSALHNGGALFKQFTIRKKNMGVGRIRDLHVTVELHVGVDSYPYRATIELDEKLSHRDLVESVRISLTSSLARTLRESIQTSLFVEVTWRDTMLYRQTFQVALLPIDEWIDTDEQRIWLPSFVLPRDPVVPRIIAQSQRYLMAISDEPTMGFCGYQSIEDLEGAPEECCAGVDTQVRAIWSALLYDLPLAYINPPPVFSDYSQRLRSPSEVVDNGRGTCIDLALLLASCLEYVEIYPVVFLLADHAFPGYWRSEKYYEDFVGALGDEDAADSRKAPRAGQRFAWYLERENFREIMTEVHEGRLVPLETVSLTERLGFAQAAERGVENLTSRRHFQALLDIISARWDERRPVTPLPVASLKAQGGEHG
jgi:hypothetical protein